MPSVHEGACLVYCQSQGSCSFAIVNEFVLISLFETSRGTRAEDSEVTAMQRPSNSARNGGLSLASIMIGIQGLRLPMNPEGTSGLNANLNHQCCCKETTQSESDCLAPSSGSH